MPRHILLALLTIAVLAATTPAQAQFMNYTPLQKLYVCSYDRVYGANSAGAPAEVMQRLMASANGLRTCKDENLQLRYFLRQPTGLHNGLCHVGETELFRDSSEGWSEVAPSSWTQLGYKPGSDDLVLIDTDGKCPLASDPAYVSIGHTRASVAAGFLRGWKDIIASPAAFDEAFAQVPFETYGFDMLKRRGVVARRAQLRRELFEGDARLTSISCEGGDCRAVIGRSIPATSIWLKNDTWISFKLEETGVVLIRMGVFLIA